MKNLIIPIRQVLAEYDALPHTNQDYEADTAPTIARLRAALAELEAQANLQHLQRQRKPS